MQNAKDILLDLMDTYKRGIHTSLEGLTPEALTFQPDDEANHIAVTIWHLARVMDAVYVHRMFGLDAENELWFTQGWAEKYNYDPRGKGSNKLGMLTGAQGMRAARKISSQYFCVFVDRTSLSLALMMSLSFKRPG